MATARQQVVPAGTDRLNKRNSLNAAARAFSNSIFVNGDHEGWLVKLPHETRGDNADDTVVPRARSEDDDWIFGGIEAERELLDRLFPDQALVRLSLAVVIVKLSRQTGGGVEARGGEGGEGVLGKVHAAGGVNARAEAKADIH